MHWEEPQIGHPAAPPEAAEQGLMLEKTSAKATNRKPTICQPSAWQWL